MTVPPKLARPDRKMWDEKRGASAINRGERYASRRESTEQTEISGTDGKKTDFCQLKQVLSSTHSTDACQPQSLDGFGIEHKPSPDIPASQVLGAEQHDAD